MFALIAIASLMYAVTWWHSGWGISPDGHQYIGMARGEHVPSPYTRRWLLPLLFSIRASSKELWRHWAHVGASATVLSAALTAKYVGGSLERQVLALLLFVGLPGIWRLNVRLPVLVDPAAYCAAVGGAVLWRSGHHALACAVWLIGAGIKETVPIFAAALTLNPIPLLFLPVPLASKLFFKQRKNPTEPYLRHPVLEARKVHDFFDWKTKLLPWGSVGILTLVALARFEWNRTMLIAGVTLALAYGQLLVAQDNARLFQWAAPAVIAVALQHPPSWVWAAVILGLFNPYRGT